MSKIKSQFVTSDGVKVTICKPSGPRAGEKTWRNNKYSVYNLGAQACKTGRRNIFATPG